MTLSTFSTTGAFLYILPPAVTLIKGPSLFLNAGRQERVSFLEKGDK